jgi:DNA-binding transcriptional ArsR family regulator
VSHAPVSQQQRVAKIDPKLLHALSNGHRMAVLSILVESEEPIKALCVRIGVSHSSLSLHLRKLRIAGLITSRRQSNIAYYRCDQENVRQLLAAFAEIDPS